MILLRVLERIQRSSGIVDIVQSEWFPRIFCVEFSGPRSGANESFGMTAHFHSRPFIHPLEPDFEWPYSLIFGVQSLDDLCSSLDGVLNHEMRNFGNNSFILKTRPGSTLRILTSFDIESDSNYLITVTFANLTLIQNDKLVEKLSKMS